LGADIITSSLGYLEFNEPPNYTWQSMDGNTARITKAADLAVRKGMIVISSIGNDGLNQFPNTINAPADGDSVISVGAVFLNKQRAPFSSYGPTVDGRIKPDLMALGINNTTARFGEGGAGYLNSYSGTSLACPMVAGVCAMILSANSNLSPMQVRDLLRETADSSIRPNNFRGWGIVNAFSAIQRSINAFIPSDFELQQNLKKDAEISLIVYDLTGKEITRILDNVFYSAGTKEIPFDFSRFSSGVYLYSLLANGNFVDSKKMVFIK
jgi:subtilisin family serine protease